MSQFRNCVVYSLDGSRWDKHIADSILAIEHSVYRRMCPDLWFCKLLSWQLTNHCHTQGGVYYFVRGNRMSGDMNTALGNCLLMVLMVSAAARHLGLSKWDLLDDGDDCLLFLEQDEEHCVTDRLVPVFLEFGQEVKLENRATVPERVVFCQTKLVWISGKPLMIRDWRKVLSQGCCGVRRWNVPKLVRSMLHAVGMCELALGPGVPILQEFALACIRNGDGKFPVGFADDEPIYMRMNRELRAWGHHALTDAFAMPVTYANRESFSRTWGISPDDQISIELRLRQWTIHSVVSELVDAELDHNWLLDVRCDHHLAQADGSDYYKMLLDEP